MVFSYIKNTKVIICIYFSDINFIYQPNILLKLVIRIKGMSHCLRPFSQILHLRHDKIYTGNKVISGLLNSSLNSTPLIELFEVGH